MYFLGINAIILLDNHVNDFIVNNKNGENCIDWNKECDEQKLPKLMVGVNIKQENGVFVPY